MHEEKLIKMELVEEVIQSVIHSALVKDSIPLSILIVAPSGSGKSKAIKQFTGTGIHFQNDLTTFDLTHLCETDKEDRIHHIVIPDLNLPLSHRASVSKLMIATLLGSTSERIKIYVTRKDGRHEIFHRPMGLISSITPAIFWKNAKKFSELGFIRRMPPIFYQQSEQTIDKIMRSIELEQVSFAQLKEKVFSPVADKIDKSVPFIHIEIATKFNHDIRMFSDMFATYLNAIIHRPSYDNRGNLRPSKEPALAPISPSLYLRSLIRGHVLYCRRTKTNASDMEFIRKFLTMTDCNNPKSL